MSEVSSSNLRLYPDWMMQAAEAVLSVIESDVGQSSRSLRLEAIRCQLWDTFERGLRQPSETPAAKPMTDAEADLHKRVVAATNAAYENKGAISPYLVHELLNEWEAFIRARRRAVETDVRISRRDAESVVNILRGAMTYGPNVDKLWRRILAAMPTEKVSEKP